MSFSESLTVRILGDSSELQRELDSVLNRFDDLRSKITETTNSARQFSTSFSRLSQALGPLQQVSSQISRISQQLQTVSQRPINLNVGPALAALQRLTQAAHQTAAAIRAIPPIPIAGPPGGRTFFPPGNGFPPRRLASGGLVSGPSGIDRVPARLTAGEYVMNRSAVETLGLGFLERLNSSPRISGNNNSAVESVDERSAGKMGALSSGMAPVPSLQTGQRTGSTRASLSHPSRPMPHSHSLESNSASSQTNNHFGGITIQVTNPSESESLLRNLQLQGIGQRIRRG